MPIKAVTVGGWAQSSVNVWMGLSMPKSDFPSPHGWVPLVIWTITPRTLEGIQHSLEEIGCKDGVLISRYFPHSTNTIWTRICTQKQTYPHTCTDYTSQNTVHFYLVSGAAVSMKWCQSFWIIHRRVWERKCCGGKIWTVICISVCTVPDRNAHPWTKMRLHTHTHTHTHTVRQRNHREFKMNQ